MVKRKNRNDVIPIDIRRIRQQLSRNMREIGKEIAFYGRVPLVPGSRVHEWEFGYRPVPGYVYTAVTYILLDSWSTDRHRATSDMHWDIDVFYGSLLNQPLGELLSLEKDLAASRSRRLRPLAKRLRHIRIEQMKSLEKVLHVSMSYVFDPEPGPGDRNLEDVA